MHITVKSFGRTSDSGMKTYFIYGEPVLNEQGINSDLVKRIIDIRFNSIYKKPERLNSRVLISHTVDRPESYDSYEEWRMAVREQYFRDIEEKKIRELEDRNLKNSLEGFLRRTFMKLM